MITAAVIIASALQGEAAVHGEQPVEQPDAPRCALLLGLEADQRLGAHFQPRRRCRQRHAQHFATVRGRRDASRDRPRPLPRCGRPPSPTGGLPARPRSRDPTRPGRDRTVGGEAPPQLLVALGGTFRAHCALLLQITSETAPVIPCSRASIGVPPGNGLATATMPYDACCERFGRRSSEVGQLPRRPSPRHIGISGSSIWRSVRSP